MARGLFSLPYTFVSEKMVPLLGSFLVSVWWFLFNSSESILSWEIDHQAHLEEIIWFKGSLWECLRGYRYHGHWCGKTPPNYRWGPLLGRRCWTVYTESRNWLWAHIQLSASWCGLKLWSLWWTVTWNCEPKWPRSSCFEPSNGKCTAVETRYPREIVWRSKDSFRLQVSASDPQDHYHSLQYYCYWPKIRLKGYRVT